MTMEFGWKVQAHLLGPFSAFTNESHQYIIDIVRFQMTQNNNFC